MTNLLLLFGAPALFGALLGLATGLSETPGTTAALVAGILGGGFVTELATGLFLSLDPDSAMIALAGFAVGGLIALVTGAGLRKKGVISTRAKRD